MKAIAKKITLAYDMDGKPEVYVTIRGAVPDKVARCQELLKKGKALDVEIRQHHSRRSLDANSYAWVIISKIADVLHTSKDEVYIEMLVRYGQREQQLVSVVEEGVPAIRRATQNHCTIVGESELNGKRFVHLAILRGSSTYTTKEMSILIDGIVSDAKDLDIETMPEEELKSLKESWG
jgi:hypothetical protein